MGNAFIAVGAGIVNMGNLAIIGFCFLSFSLLFSWKHIKPLFDKKHLRIPMRIFAGFLVLCVLLFIAASVMLAFAATKEPPENAVVIVLGCKINGSYPSLMLQSRLDAAYDYLSTHENSVCIVSGGQGDTETMPEATVMKRVLVEKGISADRIIEEPESLNTSQNLKFSAEIIEQNGYSTDVAIVTDYFHQFRGQFFAGKQGLNAFSVPAETQSWLFPTYWVRETMAVYKALIFGV